MTAPKGEPIMIPCEGSGFEPARGFGLTLCAMCGEPPVLDAAGMVVAHERDDIIARIERGDFG